MRKTITVTTAILFVELILAAIFASYVVRTSREDLGQTLEVGLSGQGAGEIAVSDLSLLPGESREYQIDLHSKAGGTYLLSLNLDAEGEDTVSPFVLVTLTFGDRTVTKNLTDFFAEGEALTVEGRLYKSRKTPATIRFSMPENVGNEAMGTAGQFRIALTLSNH